MTETLPEQEPRPAEPVVRKRRRLPTIWLLPLVASLVGVWLAFKAYVNTGPTITITFLNAEGLEAGRTKIKCRNVEVGRVTALHLGSDRTRVEVTAELNRDAGEFLSAQSRFWIVRAKVGTTGVSGLGTLLTGAYISMDPGDSGKPARIYQGLESPPVVPSAEEGRTFTLQAERLGSVTVGSQVYFRQIPAGEVLSYHLNPDGTSIAVSVFIRRPYDDLVHKDTRFWTVGGVDVAMDANGIRVNTDSLVDMLMGGIAFENPVSLEETQAVPPGYTFTLYPSHERIYDKVYQDRQYFLLYFDDSVRGLSRGAPVEFKGIKVGQVEDLKLEFLEDKLAFRVPVLVAIEPERLTVVGPDHFRTTDLVLQKLVARGLRAQLKMGSLLTNKLYVDLDIYPKAPPKTAVRQGKYLEIPTLPTTMGALVANFTRFLDRLEKLPLEDIAAELKAALPALRETLVETKSLVRHLDKETAPQAQATLAELEKVLRSDAPTQTELRRTLDAFTQASRALRDLADTLDRNPESVIWGKEKKP